MAKQGEIYVCGHCGLEVQVVKEASGTPGC